MVKFNRKESCYGEAPQPPCSMALQAARDPSNLSDPLPSYSSKDDRLTASIFLLGATYTTFFHFLSVSRRVDFQRLFSLVDPSSLGLPYTLSRSIYSNTGDILESRLDFHVFRPTGMGGG